MKWFHSLPLAALSTAIVIPSEEVLADLVPQGSRQPCHKKATWYNEAAEEKDHIVEEIKGHWDQATQSGKDAWASILRSSHNALDQAYEYGSDAVDTTSDKLHESALDVQSWLDETTDEAVRAFDRPRRRPHHPPHEPNLTVYQLIASSKYTTKLAKLINEYDDLVSALNSTKANYTVFAPTNEAFEKIPDHAPKPPKEFLKKVLEYHVVPDVYTAARVFASHTAPTLLKSPFLGENPQRIAFKLGLRGLTVNFYSRIIAVNIPGTNGVIHGVDSFIVPPPPAVEAIGLFPGEFSTLSLGLAKTGLLQTLNTTTPAPMGGTLFAPSNFAFQKLGPRINAFLFSKYGTKYLKALLEYHIVFNHTLYSDAYYVHSKTSNDDAGPIELADSDPSESTVPKGRFHFDLPTLLKGRSLAVDVARFGRFITMKINAFSTVAVQDGIVADGVIHVVGDVLIPPRRAAGVEEVWTGEDMSVEELIARLEPLVEYESDL